MREGADVRAHAEALPEVREAAVELHLAGVAAVGAERADARARAGARRC